MFQQNRTEQGRASPIMIRILVADDDKNLRTVLATELSAGDYDVAVTESGAVALERMQKEEYDVLLLDLNMPGISGMDVLKKMKSFDVSTEVIVLTAHATISAAVEAMKLGAYDFLTKPFKLEELSAVVEKAYEKKKILIENLLLKSQLRIQSETPGIVTKSPRMLDILQTVRKAARSELPVAIFGESGVGKELVARAIHDASGRAEGPFIPINCGAIPEHVIESEFFGHERGAFTGAHIRKLGLLEIANRGTLFLDEVGDLPLHLQVKLLRAFETKKFFRVGGVKELTVDIRLVSATNKDIKKSVDEGLFRADLYFRISAITFTIPPLRERREDITLLVEHFLQLNPDFRRKRFTAAALKTLSEYSWPGNVRELQNMVHRILLLSPNDIIEACDLPADFIDCRKESNKRLVDVEREHILAVLQETDGHRGRAAEVLGIDPKTLYRKLLEYGVKT